MSRVRSLARLLAIVALAGCYRWSAPQPAPQSALETHSAQARLTLTDGRQLVLNHPRVGGDDLLGDSLVVKGVNGSRFEVVRVPTRVAIPLTDVRSVSRRQFSPGRTALFAVATVYALVGMNAAANGCCGGHIGLATGR